MYYDHLKLPLRDLITYIATLKKSYHTVTLYNESGHSCSSYMYNKSTAKQSESLCLLYSFFVRYVFDG